MSNKSFDQYAYINEHKRNNYDRLSLLVKKGGKDTLKQLAEKYTNGSVNALIIGAVEEKYNIDLSK